MVSCLGLGEEGERKREDSIHLTVNGGKWKDGSLKKTGRIEAVGVQVD